MQVQDLSPSYLLNHNLNTMLPKPKNGESFQKIFERIIDTIDKQSEAIIKLAEYVDRVNTNSRVPFNSNVEEEIEQILG